MYPIKEQKAFLAIISVFGAVALLNVWYFVGHYRPGGGAQAPVVSPAQASAMAITTDRIAYRVGEPVMVYFANISAKSMREQEDGAVTVVSDHDLGRNYGVGMIERLTDSGWLAVEPVWRCASPCHEACLEPRLIEAQDKEEFMWEQSVLHCGRLEGTTITVPAGSGRYRVTSAVWMEELKSYKQVHSLEFTIK